MFISDKSQPLLPFSLCQIPKCFLKSLARSHPNKMSLLLNLSQYYVYFYKSSQKFTAIRSITAIGRKIGLSGTFQCWAHTYVSYPCSFLAFFNFHFKFRKASPSSSYWIHLLYSWSVEKQHFRIKMYSAVWWCMCLKGRSWKSLRSFEADRVDCAAGRAGGGRPGKNTPL